MHKRHITDELVILEMTVTGTHSGEWRDLPALGRRMASRVCALYSFDEEGMLEPRADVLRQRDDLEQLGIYQDPRKPVGKVMAVADAAVHDPAAFVRRALRRS